MSNHSMYEIQYLAHVLYKEHTLAYYVHNYVLKIIVRVSFDSFVSVIKVRMALNLFIIGLLIL